MLRNILRAAALAVGAAAGPPAAAGEIRIDQPLVDGVPVDWCRSWGQGCGWPGAHAFCRDRGYEGALQYEIFKPGRTYIVNDDAFCTSPGCTAFLSVTCKMAPGQSAQNRAPMAPADPARPARVRFDHPRNEGAPADWCSVRGLDCGWGGAHKFCEYRGFDRAIGWSSYRPGLTKVLGESAPCRGPGCVALRHVVCERQATIEPPPGETSRYAPPPGYGPPGAYE
jgi:hypothetical protein